MYATSHPSTALRKAQASDPREKGSKLGSADWHGLLPLGCFQAAQGAGTQPEPGDSAVVKREKQEFGDTEVPSICETDYERGDCCVERAGELQNLSLWLSSDLCRMQDREKNGQEAHHYTPLEPAQGKCPFPPVKAERPQERTGYWVESRKSLVVVGG